jgi:hypothetical protein
MQSFKMAPASPAVPVVCNELLSIISTETKSPRYLAKSTVLPIVSRAVAY